MMVRSVHFEIGGLAVPEERAAVCQHIPAARTTSGKSELQTEGNRAGVFSDRIQPTLEADILSPIRVCTLGEHLSLSFYLVSLQS